MNYQPRGIGDQAIQGPAPYLSELGTAEALLNDDHRFRDVEALRSQLAHEIREEAEHTCTGRRDPCFRFNWSMRRRLGIASVPGETEAGSAGEQPAEG